MKKLLFFLLALSPVFGVFAQNSQGKVDDFGRITLAAYVPEQIDEMPVSARSILSNKLSQIVTESGMGGSAMNERFIITANVSVMSKNITATAPAMHALSLDITLYIGDGIDGTKFSSTSVSVKGVGENETKAYISAIKGINANNNAIKTFIESGKAKILKYYNTKCDFIISDAQSLASQGRYEEAFYKLSGIPEISKDCYNKARSIIIPIYKKHRDKICQTRLMEAKTIWAASQNYDGAVAAGDILSQIDPTSACYAEVKKFVAEIAKGVKEKDNKEWQFIFKQQQLDSDVLKSAYSLGMAYANRQPQAVVYNVKGWW
ncbi:hypothetical protein EZ428_02210 [Pedobacter frigiditerrae]|uniref:Tetratricopeptide repeat-containing protein n=1 Tax=Pedobacter frigiditerrae TaxID=2530452 RepID=A0A4V2MJB9_9SPHI|nr:hypothetical protein [Pedobacter frigiditerrae]TCC93606.1 hypothetical protein EZ428_02210 [Pedobacter frigiditerrae]